MEKEILNNRKKVMLMPLFLANSLESIICQIRKVIASFICLAYNTIGSNSQAALGTRKQNLQFCPVEKRAEHRCAR